MLKRKETPCQSTHLDFQGIRRPCQNLEHGLETQHCNTSYQLLWDDVEELRTELDRVNKLLDLVNDKAAEIKTIVWRARTHD